jgi:hypothetical protein
MKTKTILVQLTVCCIFLLILTGCNDFLKDFKLGEVYYFTKDDLSYLYIDKDTLTPYEREVNYEDTVFFLLNSKDKCMAKVFTTISPGSSSWGGFEDYYWGFSILKFNGTSKIKTAEIQVEKDSIAESQKWLTVSCKCDWFTCRIDSSITSKFDTAQILNHVYTNVIKCYPSVKDSTSTFKSVYFDKNIGFIKIETVDGEKLELINDPK